MKNKYTNKEYIKMYENYKDLCADMISKIVKYEGWKGETGTNQATRLYDKIIEEFKGIDFTLFSLEELDKLGFREWDDEIILAPIWAVECFEKGIEIYSISGDKQIVGEAVLDLDVRMGVTAYGFNKSQLRDSKLEKILEEK